VAVVVVVVVVLGVAVAAVLLLSLSFNNIQQLTEHPVSFFKPNSVHHFFSTLFLLWQLQPRLLLLHRPRLGTGR
jgi:ABC-type thiamin/hydroxymethylpyrimidine transport system permease subunit